MFSASNFVIFYGPFATFPSWHLPWHIANHAAINALYISDAGYSSKTIQSYALGAARLLHPGRRSHHTTPELAAHHSPRYLPRFLMYKINFKRSIPCCRQGRIYDPVRDSRAWFQASERLAVDSAGGCRPRCRKIAARHWVARISGAEEDIKPARRHPHNPGWK